MDFTLLKKCIVLQNEDLSFRPWLDICLKECRVDKFWRVKSLRVNVTCHVLLCPRPNFTCRWCGVISSCFAGMHNFCFLFWIGWWTKWMMARLKNPVACLSFTYFCDHHHEAMKGIFPTALFVTSSNLFMLFNDYSAIQILLLMNELRKDYCCWLLALDCPFIMLRSSNITFGS